MPINEEGFNLWCQKSNLGSQAKQIISTIRNSEPSRRVGGRGKNVSGRYPSRKMGMTIQFESHKVELPFIYQLEYDENVLEFYDQPPPIKISCQSASGRNLGFYITPDFFILNSHSVGWVECKTEEDLQKLAEKNPSRYCLGADNRWHSPPAEEYAQQFGFYFRVWSNTEVNWNLQRNLEFLEDYYRCQSYKVTEAVSNRIVSIVAAQPGISLAELLERAVEIRPDDIHFAIAFDLIFSDLSTTFLTEPERCFLFRDQQTAKAYDLAFNSKETSNGIFSPVFNLIPGTRIVYDNKVLTVTLIGETGILLQTDNGELTELTVEMFNKLLSQGKLTAFETETKHRFEEKLLELLKKTSTQDLLDANQRYYKIQPYINGGSIKSGVEQERSLRNWLSAYQQAQRQYNYGYFGLIHLSSSKGNRNRKLPKNVLEHVEKFIEEKYETKNQKRKQAVYAEFAYFCSESGIPDSQIPSYKTFVKEIKRRGGYEQTLKREGHRAAYSFEEFHWELKLTTPRHGSFPFHIGHIDHTPTDIELRCSKTGKVLGRAWITFLMDAFTRRILAVYLSYDPPSYRSCMMVLRICVRRYSRLPQILVVDNGKEFHSTYFETLLACFEITLKHRPVANPRFGGICERLFGTTNSQFILNLAGNTQISKKVRLMTKSVNPKELSLWPLSLLYFYLCEWAYKVYDSTEHPALSNQSPQEAFGAGITYLGSRNHRYISYDENFRLLTMPTTTRGRAKVEIGKGIKIEYKYHWSNVFRDPEVQGTFVEVRYDPFDAGIAYAYVKGRWVDCISEYYVLFHGRSEREIQLATAELKKRQQNHAKNYKVRAKQLGQFLASADVEESVLKQRLCDEQMQEVFRVIEHETLNPQPSRQPKDTFDDLHNQEVIKEPETTELSNLTTRRILGSY